MYVGYKCNINCIFCYYENNVKEWHSLDACKNQAHLFKNKYKNNFIDITGGEPTIYPNILELISYCQKIGIKPTVITNMQSLANFDTIKKFKDAGVEEFLCSIHGLHKQHDEITRSSGSFIKSEQCLQHLNSLKIPFRINCVINSINYKNLKNIAEFVKNQNCTTLNYIFCNIFKNLKTHQYQPKFSEIKPYLHEALNYCDSKQFQVNVRYVPFCFMKGHEKKCRNFPQLPYDFHEWDCKSWMSINSNAADVIKIKEDTYKLMNDEDAYKFLINKLTMNYIHPTACNNCCFINICDGLNKEYISHYGINEISTQYGPTIQTPNYFLKIC